MPITLTPWAPLEANLVAVQFATQPSDMIPNDVPDGLRDPFPVPEKPQDVLQSSFAAIGPSDAIYPSTNGFIYGAIEAYANHHHLVIRPEDIWFAILTQFSSYVVAHAEELRHQFVNHDGQKELRIEYREFDYRKFVLDMNQLLGKVVTDPKLRGWMLPNFTTTTQNDKVVTSIVMMGTLKKYFTYTVEEICGLPSVTLLGEKSDYEELLRRVEKLTAYGEEPTQFAALLRSVVARFSHSFDAPTSRETTSFWRRIFSRYDMCGKSSYTGWITAFMFWNEEGKLICRGWRDECAEIDGVQYQYVDSRSIAPAWVSVPINIRQGSSVKKAQMTAGSLGIECSSTGAKTADGSVGLGRMQPLLGWWIYEEKEEQEKTKPEVESHRCTLQCTVC